MTKPGQPESPEIVVSAAEILHMMLGIESETESHDLDHAEEDPAFAEFRKRFAGKTHEEIGSVFNLD